MRPSQLFRTAALAAAITALTACAQERSRHAETGAATSVETSAEAPAPVAPPVAAPMALQPPPLPAPARRTDALSVAPVPTRLGPIRPARAEAANYTLAGYRVYADDGRLWVFRDGSPDLASFLEQGEPAKRVTLIGRGPDGKTLLGSDKAVLESYAAVKRYTLPGFAVIGDDGRLWAFRAGSAHHKEFLAKGEPAKRVTLIGAGPDGKTLLGAERSTLEDYGASWAYRADGYVVIGDDGRLWVFREGSRHLAEFLAQGEPAKRVTLIGSGPGGKTLLGAERDVLEAYVSAVAAR